MQAIQPNPQNPIIIQEPVVLPNKCTMTRVCKIAAYLFAFILSCGLFILAISTPNIGFWG